MDGTSLRNRAAVEIRSNWMCWSFYPHIDVIDFPDRLYIFVGSFLLCDVKMVC